MPEKWVADEEKYLEQQFQLKNPSPEVVEMMKTMALRNVKRTFLTDAIYDAEPNLKVTEEEAEAFFKQEAERAGTSTLTLKAELKKQGMLDGVFGIIKNNKVMNFILSNATIEDAHIEENHVCNCNNDCNNCVKE